MSQYPMSFIISLASRSILKEGIKRHLISEHICSFQKKKKTCKMYSTYLIMQEKSGKGLGRPKPPDKEALLTSDKERVFKTYF